MSQREGHLSPRPRRPVLPCASTRTLHHPSFLPLYMAADFGRQRGTCSGQTAHAIIPAEFYYTDPTMACGRRIPNAVTDLRVLECLQLNTPPPVMSTRLATPYCPDPFISAPHATRDLGSATWNIPPHHCQVQPNPVVLQLSQEEDLAITNLLKLRHQNPLQSAKAFGAANKDFSSAVHPPPDVNSRLFHQRPADPASVYTPMCSDVQYPKEMQERGGWSDTELEAADTLSRFVLSEDQSDQKEMETHPDSLPYEHPSLNTETRHGSEALAALVTAAATQNDTGFGCSGGAEEPVQQDVVSAADGLVSAGFPEARGQTLSDSEGDAVRVLLSLWM